MKYAWIGVVLAASVMVTGCAQSSEPTDYTAFRHSNPRSILVLPPLNESPDVNAVNGMLAQSTKPLAESGYYVFPVALVQQTFRQNGLDHAADIHAVPLKKLESIFGADAVLYLTVRQYGTSYQLIASDTRVTADALLVDAHSGEQLWKGSATASSTEGQSNNQGLLGALIQAAVDQIVNNLNDKSYAIAGIASSRLLQASQPHGLLYGPRSPDYQSEAAQ